MNTNYHRILAVIVWLVERAFNIKCLDERKHGFSIVAYKDATFYGDIQKMELPEGASVTATAKPMTAAGHTGKYEVGTAKWVVADETIASATPNPDNELECKFTGLDGSENKSTAVSCSFDGDPDAEERLIVLEGVLTVTQGEATVGSLDFSAVDDPNNPTA